MSDTERDIREFTRELAGATDDISEFQKTVKKVNKRIQHFSDMKYAYEQRGNREKLDKVFMVGEKFVKTSLTGFQMVMRQVESSFAKMHTDIDRTVDDIADAHNEYRDSIDKLSNALKTEERVHMKYADMPVDEQIAAYQRNIEKTRVFTDNIAKSSYETGVFVAALLENRDAIKMTGREYEKYVGRLKDSISNVDKQVLTNFNMWDEALDELQGDLNPHNFSALAENLGKIQSTIDERLSKLNITNISEIKIPDLMGNVDDALSTNNSEIKKTLEALGIILKDVGFDIKTNIDNISTAEEYEGLKAEIEKAAGVLASTNKALAREALLGNSKLLRTLNSLQEFMAADGFKGKKDYLLKALKEKSSDPQMWKQLDSAVSRIGSLWNSMVNSKLYTDLTAFNQLYAPTTYIDSVKTGISLGMKSSDLYEAMAQNKDYLVANGSGDEATSRFIALSKNIGKTFSLADADAAKMTASVNDFARVTGVNVRDQDALARASNMLGKSFDSMGGIIDVTKQQYMTMLTQMMKQGVVSQDLLGLDKERAQGYGNSLIRETKLYRALSLSTEAAMGLLEEQRKQQRLAYEDKLTNAFKSEAMGAAIGLDKKTLARFRELTLNPDRTPEQQVEFVKLQAKLTTDYEKLRRNKIDEFVLNNGGKIVTDANGNRGYDAVGQEILNDSRRNGSLNAQLDVLERGFKEIGFTASEAVRAQVANAIKSGNEINLKELEAGNKAATPDKAIIGLQNAVNQVSELFQNSLSSALLKAVGATGSLAASSGYAAYKLLKFSKALDAASPGSGGLGGPGAGGAGGPNRGPNGAPPPGPGAGAGAAGSRWGRLASIFGGTKGKVLVGILGALLATQTFASTPDTEKQPDIKESQKDPNMQRLIGALDDNSEAREDTPRQSNTSSLAPDTTASSSSSTEKTASRKQKREEYVSRMGNTAAVMTSAGLMTAAAFGAGPTAGLSFIPALLADAGMSMAAKGLTEYAAGIVYDKWIDSNERDKLLTTYEKKVDRAIDGTISAASTKADSTVKPPEKTQQPSISVVEKTDTLIGAKNDNTEPRQLGPGPIKQSDKGSATPIGDSALNSPFADKYMSLGTQLPYKMNELEFSKEVSRAPSPSPIPDKKTNDDTLPSLLDKIVQVMSINNEYQRQLVANTDPNIAQKLGKNSMPAEQASIRAIDNSMIGSDTFLRFKG